MCKYIRHRPKWSLWGNRVWDRAANISKEKKWSYLFSVSWKRIVWLLKKMQIQGKHPKLKKKPSVSHVSKSKGKNVLFFCKFEAMQAFIVSFTLHQWELYWRWEGGAWEKMGKGRPHQSGRGRHFHGLAVMVSINILMGSVVCPIIHCRWNGWMNEWTNEWGGLISWSVVCSQCNTFLLSDWNLC